MRSWGSRHVLLTALPLLASAVATAGTVTVDPSVVLGGGLFHYSYSITNTTPDDSFLIDVPVPADPLAVMNLTAPAGYVSAFDSGLGLVSFLEDSLVFGPSPVAGFSFDSPVGPGSVSFAATAVSMTDGSLYTISGPTSAPVAPEPATLPLVAAAAAGLMAFGLKSSRSARLGGRRR